MDALKNLIGNCPDWVHRLDELSGQIEKRQIELAQSNESQSKSSSASGSGARSLKNRGSTESLKPKDDSEAHPNHRETSPEHPPLERPADVDAAHQHEQNPPSSPTSNPNSQTPSALQRQTNQVMLLAQSRARAAVRKRHRTESMISAEGAAPKYRSRNMIIVYYDSYVQSFFEELVKFVSASRNLMRKAKMAAKVAQIKRMAELEMPDEDEDEEMGGGSGTGGPLKPDAPLEASTKNAGEDDASEDLPPLKYVSTRQMRPVTRSAAAKYSLGRPVYARAGMGRFGSSAGGMVDQPPDVYDELDKGLEYVQSMCEHAAHQFLRDGDCGEEVENIKRRLGETKELADKEMERVLNDPEAAKKLEEPTNPRSFRPQSMRREVLSSSSAKNVATELEVDEGVEDLDEAEPKLVYKSTRMMR